MDYKERIEYLRSVTLRKNNCYGCQECKDAVDTIETLLAERDAIMQDLRYMARCRACKYDNVNWNDAPCRKCFAGDMDCWEWRGPQAKREG